MQAQTFSAIGVDNVVVVEDDTAIGQAVAIAEREVELLDLACSRFRDDSELARLSRASGCFVEVGDLLFSAIEVALDAAAATDGLVDPTVGRSLRGIGYDRSFEVIVRAGAVPRFTYVAAGGWERVRLDRSWRAVLVPRGTELDLGATAKAFAADRIA